jgi:DNA-binding transcriptional regulator YhcF (GntR family)
LKPAGKNPVKTVLSVSKLRPMNFIAALGLDIKEQSRTPKYRQIVSEINNKIEKGVISFGQKLPSINALSEDYLLSRNTVEKAYILLKQEGIIEAVRGKGYFVKNAQPVSKMRVMLLFNKLSDYKRVVYDSIARELQGIADVDLYVYYADISLFRRILAERREDYHYYLVMPHFRNENEEQVKAILSSLPKEKLILLDRKLEYFNESFGNVYQDFKMDIYETLANNKALIRKYKKLTLAFPEDTTFPYPTGIVHGFRRFCLSHDVEFDIVGRIDDNFELVSGEGVITVAESDLVAIIKKIKSSGLRLSRDFGVISYNETALKEVLANGVTVITTDFAGMGKMAARMIKEKKGMDIRNNFKLIERSSW